MKRTATVTISTQYGISASNKTIEEINAEVNKARADAEASARREGRYLESVGGYSQLLTVVWVALQFKVAKQYNINYFR